MHANEYPEAFEELLAALAAGEIDASGLRALDEFVQSDAALGKRYRRFVETLDLVNLPAPGELEIPELERDPAYALDAGAAQERADVPVGAGPNSGSRARWWPAALAAAALLLAVPLILPLVTNPDDRATTAAPILTHAQGSCRSGAGAGETTKIGTSPRFARMHSGPDSICDLHFTTPARITLRLLANSRLHFSVHARSLNLSLEGGEALIDAQKIPGNVRVSLHSSGHLVEVAGTRLILHRPRFETFQVELLAGAARVRSAHYLHLPGLRHGLHQAGDHQAKLADRLPALFAESEALLDPGARLLFEHPPGYAVETAPLMRALNAHVNATAPPPANPRGAHEISPELLANLEASFDDHPHLHEHFQKGPPEATAERIPAERAARLADHFSDARKRLDSRDD